MSDADLEGDARAVAKSKDVRRVDLEVSKEGRDVVGGGLERDRRVAIGGAAVPLLLHRDDSAADGKDREDSAERDLNGGSAAVKQDERNAVSTTVDLVVHADAVDRRVAALEWLVRRPWAGD
jgi:hypothetical protein